MFYYRSISICLSIILSFHALFPAVMSETFIKTKNGLVCVDDLVVGDTIVGYKNYSLVDVVVTRIYTDFTNTIVRVATHGGCINALPDQLFFDPINAQWIKAKDIIEHTVLLDSCFNHHMCYGGEIINVHEAKIYHISTTAPHIFFVSEHELLTHNAFPLMIGIAWLFGEGIKFAGLSIGTSLLGTYLGVELYNKHKQKDAQRTPSFHVIPSGCPDPDPDDDENKNLFESIKLRSNKKLRHNRFGNFYRDPKTKLWWSKDRANHGGSMFKVFKENARGLELLFDADEFGNQIVGKHKGSTGLFIEYKELIVCR